MPPGGGKCGSRPFGQIFRTFKQPFGNPPVGGCHRFALPLKREGRHALGFESRPGFVIRLEIERVASNEAKINALGADPRAAEHRPDPHGPEPGQQFLDELPEFPADSHGLGRLSVRVIHAHRRDGDGFAAAAGAGLIGIIEAETGGQLVRLIVHLRPEQEQDGLRLDEDLDALILDDVFARGRGLGVGHGIFHARASALFHANTQPRDRIGAGRNDLLDALSRGVRQTHHLRACKPRHVSTSSLSP